MINPTLTRLSRHFLLSDFLGNHSVYTRGHQNRIGADATRDEMQLRIDNGMALCEEALEPMLAKYGPMSVSYGFIEPSISREIVTYMDPNKPSHHRWDLGAAADVCVHNWVNGNPMDDTISTAPIALAHEVSNDGLPYSRMITYSESPYICIAVSANEVFKGKPRKAFYENRYEGLTKQKPIYKQCPTGTSRDSNYAALLENGLPHGWRGADYPTYHGGGRRQMQHVRVSKYTMVSDWLFDLQSIADGEKNIPNFNNQRLWDTFCAVGDAYDELIEIADVARFSIIAGFVSHTNPNFDPDNDWRTGTAKFSLVTPEGVDIEKIRMKLLFGYQSKITGFGDSPFQLDMTVQL